jgi:hypothetical protein
VIVIQTMGDASELIVDPGSEAYFQAMGGTRAVTGVHADGSKLILQLGEGQDPTSIAYVGHPRSGPWVTNANGIGLLAFQLPL